MTVAIGIVAVLVWLVAAYAFVRVLLAWLGVMRLAPSGQKFETAFELGFWNFPAVERRIGAPVAPHLDSYRKGFLIFFAAVLGFMVLVIVNIVTGNAA